MIQRPCRGCAERRMGCHGHCAKEALWLAATAALRAQQEKERQTNAACRDHIKQFRLWYLKKRKG